MFSVASKPHRAPDAPIHPSNAQSKNVRLLNTYRSLTRRISNKPTHKGRGGKEHAKRKELEKQTKAAMSQAQIP